MGELKPCPFCGESLHLLVNHVEGTILHPAYYVQCDNCVARGAATDKDHVAAWNSRAPSKAERDAVLEEAAVACENESISEIGPGDHEYNLAIQHCAESIRLMKGRP